MASSFTSIAEYGVVVQYEKKRPFSMITQAQHHIWELAKYYSRFRVRNRDPSMKLPTVNSLTTIMVFKNVVMLETAVVMHTVVI